MRTPSACWLPFDRSIGWALAYGVADVLVTDVTKEAVAALVLDGARASTLDGIMAEADIVVATTGRPGRISCSIGCAATERALPHGVPERQSI